MIKVVGIYMLDNLTMVKVVQMIKVIWYCNYYKTWNDGNGRLSTIDLCKQNKFLLNAQHPFGN